MRISDWSSDVCSSDLDTKSIRELLRERKDVSALLLVSPKDAALYGEPKMIERITPYAMLLLREADHERTLRRIGLANRPPQALVAIPPSAPDQGRAGERPVVAQVEQGRMWSAEGRTVSLRVDQGGTRSIKKKN